jgi:LmbE family N-acetylglucosaminyl deacetylase
MRLSFAGDRVLAVVAHPDDAELLCAGTLARARSEGAAVAVAVLCRGEKGQPAEPIRNLAAVRKQEMAAAAKLLGAELFPCGFPDGTLADGAKERQALLRVYRRFRPTLVLAHAPQDYHADHRAASALAEVVSWSCASRGQESDLLALEAPPALWWLDCIALADFEPGFYIDISEHVSLKERMLLCHQSQLRRGPEKDFAPLLDLMRLQSQTRGLQSGVAAAEAFRLHRAFKRAAAW